MHFKDHMKGCGQGQGNIKTNPGSDISNIDNSNKDDDHDHDDASSFKSFRKLYFLVPAVKLHILLCSSSQLNRNWVIYGNLKEWLVKSYRTFQFIHLKTDSSHARRLILNHAVVKISQKLRLKPEV